MIQEKNPYYPALIFRSLALFLILYQLRLIAADMADTSVFVSTILAAYAAVFFLQNSKKNPSSLAALLIIALIPWCVRSIIAIPGLIFRFSAVSTFTITLDALLLNFDRNNFIVLLPFYWAAVTTWFSFRSQKFLRAIVIADAVLLLIIYSIVRSADIPMYRWPVVMIIIFGSIVFLQAMALLFSVAKEFRVRKTETASAVIVTLLLIFFGSLLFLKPLQQQALGKGGGLLEPKLFSFDFSKILKLDPEISMSDDLIMIVKKEGDDDHILMRRSVLSGYSSKQGFYKLEDLDEQTHPQRLPARPTEINTSQSSRKKPLKIRQEYFLVNFDAAAFIAMNQPVSVSPYENWDASSFRSAFMVDSIASNASMREILRSAQEWPDVKQLGISDAEFKIYTEYGNDVRIRDYAGKLTNNVEKYGEKVFMIYNRLKYGEYRYSLKPGIAPDGDQLAWFLFNTKKGYCTYYAFAMTLMLRSLGIPARTAAGFFMDPDTNTFDYYPVRADMAHAWVEVLFPDYGWIEFDPTTEYLAEGEEFRFSAGVDPNLFEKLMREILENRSQLKIKQGKETAESVSMSSLLRTTTALLKQNWHFIVLMILAIFIVIIRCKYLILFTVHKDKRKKAVILWKHCRQRLLLAGIKTPAAEYESEWAHNTDLLIQGTYTLYQQSAAARFAPDYSDDDFTQMKKNYADFCKEYKKTVSALRRIIAWVLPLLALVLPPAKPNQDSSHNNSKTRKKQHLHAKLLMLLALLLLFYSRDSTAQTTAFGTDPEQLYENALDSIYAEHWEQAIETLKKGERQFPWDIRFPWVLGDLYYGRSLYGLAWEEYKKAEAIDPHNESIFLLLANTAGFLNKLQTSIEYYQKALLINPGNRSAISNLGWTLYKVHRLTEGEKLLLGAVNRFGEDAEFTMTLGTIYSTMYKYDQSKYWYKNAISSSLEINDMDFAAVAHYNLSILESRFYHYDLAMNETNSSLNARRRASGMIARGELNLRKQELKQAQLDYQTAYEMDTSPLAKINLAYAYLKSGRLEEARLYAQDCLKASDNSWMLNYGIDPDRYKADIHETLYDTYKGLANTESFLPRIKPGEAIRSVYRKITFRYKAAIHQRLFEKYTLAAADAYRAELQNDSPLLDAVFRYYNSFKRYRFRSKLYFNFARDMETDLIPASIPSYNANEGTQFKDLSLLEQALGSLNPVWERDLISDCYEYIAANTRQTTEQQLAAEELFAINRGGLRRAGIALPVEINVLFDSALHDAKNTRALQRLEKLLLKSLKKTGFKISDKRYSIEKQKTHRYKLDLNLSDAATGGYVVLCELTDTLYSNRMFQHSFPLENIKKQGVYNFARNFTDKLFVVE